MQRAKFLIVVLRKLTKRNRNIFKKYYKFKICAGLTLFENASQTFKATKMLRKEVVGN